MLTPAGFTLGPMRAGGLGRRPGLGVPAALLTGSERGLLTESGGIMLTEAGAALLLDTIPAEPAIVSAWQPTSSATYTETRPPSGRAVAAFPETDGGANVAILGNSLHFVWAEPGEHRPFVDVATAALTEFWRLEVWSTIADLGLTIDRRPATRILATAENVGGIPAGRFVASESVQIETAGWYAVGIGQRGGALQSVTAAGTTQAHDDRLPSVLGVGPPEWIFATNISGSEHQYQPDDVSAIAPNRERYLGVGARMPVIGLQYA